MAAMATAAIITKLLVPTNTRGARVKATTRGGSITLPWSNGASVEENHAPAANKLAIKLSLLRDGDRLIGGEMPDGMGFAYIVVHD